LHRASWYYGISVFKAIGDIKSFACHISGSQRHDVSECLVDLCSW